MKEEILRIIEWEDPKNPLTDEEIGKRLQILRETVTGIRKDAKIADSRERRKGLLLREIGNILTDDSGESERGITKKLNDAGFVIGKYAVGRILEENKWLRDGKNDGDRLGGEAVKTGEVPEIRKPIQYGQSEKMIRKDLYTAEALAENVFQRFIGYDGSMKNQISKSRAAVIYPPRGLHTLIYGPSGVGKSFLAELMHEYSVTTDNFDENAPYFEFNCADYADNPQLLLAQLFGYAKGAFTGATEHKKGVVELCDGGILFLDEIHRLPAEGQEILFYLMDKGKFRRLGEVDTQRESHPLIIGATTEDPESALLLTFRRRIPMSIELPSLKDRPNGEKMRFVKAYFATESRRLGRDLYVEKEVQKCLLTVTFPGNVGQLKSDIQVCCAKAFLESKVRGAEKILVSMDNMSESVKKQYSRTMVTAETLSVIAGDLIFSAEGNGPLNSPVESLGESGVYDKLNKRYEELGNRGVGPEEIRTILAREVEETLTHHIKRVESSGFSRMEVANIVGRDILAITEEIYQKAKKELPTLKENVLFPMAIHLSAAVAHMKSKKRTMADNLEDVKRQYFREYEIAKRILPDINKKYYLCLSDDEAVFFAMYLNKFQNTESVGQGKIGLIVLSHGRVACGMAEVANTIMGVEYAVGLEMDLKDSPEVMLEKTMAMVRERNQGQGCILLADMGSLLSFGERISRELGIPVKVIARTDTQLVIECLRKILWTEDGLEEITRQLEGRFDRIVLSRQKNEPKKSAILSLCITGLGAAKNIQTLLMDRLKSVIRDVEIVTRGYIENQKVENIIKEVSEQYNILVIVGTINPEVTDYPFIPVSDIYEGQGISTLRKILKRALAFEGSRLGEVIQPELIFVNPGFSYKEEVLDHAVEAMVDLGGVDQNFLLSVYKREGQMTTYLRGGIAIPHGDSACVTKPAISITKLAKSIVWDGVNTVDVIFMLALNENSKYYFEQLYQLISDESLITAVRNSNSIGEIKEILHLNTKPVK